MRVSFMVALRGILAATILGTAFLSGCSRDAGAPATPGGTSRDRGGSVTVQGDDRIAESLTWQAPAVELPASREAALAKAAAALAAGHLYEDAEAAIPLYLALVRQEPGDPLAREGLQHALAALLVSGKGFLATSGDDIEALRAAHRIAAVARTVAPDDAAVSDYLRRVDTADQLWELNRQAEADLRAGRLGEPGTTGGALPKLRAALRLQPGQSRAMQGLAAVESGLIRRAEDAARKEDFASASRWLGVASAVRGDVGTIADARTRIGVIRRLRIDQLHDEGMQALLQTKGIPVARGKLAQMLRIADPADAAVAELRQRIDQVTHYGQFRAGQHFTDGLKLGARSPEMVVVPHGGFRMGAADDDDDAGDVEKPAHYVRFARGFAMSRTEVTVDQFRDFVRSTGYRPTAARRGRAMVYDERSGNFVRRRGVGWESAYDGSPAGGSLPVVFVSSRDAQAYADWLAAQSGQRYRLPSEAEFEYALRAGRSGRYPWGSGAPSGRAENIAGEQDVSPGGRHWSNAYPGYGDGFWGPAPVGRFRANAYDLHDLAGNVGEWVADCWHDSYRRAPGDGAAWLNPGCRMGVVRGGSWASSPAQVRSAWRAPLDAEATNARIGFRVVREI